MSTVNRTTKKTPNIRSAVDATKIKASSTGKGRIYEPPKPVKPKPVKK